MPENLAVIVCPACGMPSSAVMPENACLRFYECSGCGELISPKPGDCCVFCSYGDQVCPPRARQE